VKLVCATLFLNEPRMVVYIEADGRVRRVETKWTAVGPEAASPPVQWAESARGEVEYQRGVEKSPSLMGRFR
jgi:hypothetical protein